MQSPQFKVSEFSKLGFKFKYMLAHTIIIYWLQAEKVADLSSGHLVYTSGWGR